MLTLLYLFYYLFYIILIILSNTKCDNNAKNSFNAKYM